MSFILRQTIVDLPFSVFSNHSLSGTFDGAIFYVNGNCEYLCIVSSLGKDNFRNHRASILRHFRVIDFIYEIKNQISTQIKKLGRMKFTR